MSERPSAGIGKRVAKYRKLAGLSARELSEKLGGELSRGVIANIESGRKTDVTVDQLISLAWALGIPPVVLALPVEEPHKFVKMYEGPRGASQLLRSWGVVNWFNARPMFSRNTPGPEGEIGEFFDTKLRGPATVLAESLLKAHEERVLAEAGLRRAKELFATGDVEQVVIDEREAELAGIESRLRDLGADLTVFKVDE